MSLLLLLLLAMICLAVGLFVFHLQGYRPGGTYDRLAIRDAARRAGEPDDVFATAESFARFLADPRAPRC